MIVQDLGVKLFTRRYVTETETEEDVRERALTLPSRHAESQQRRWCDWEGHVPSAAEGSLCMTQRWTHREGHSR